MKVTYLGHSGFLVELDTAYFLFDYYTGQIPVLDESKTLVIFSSHRHQDHYNRKIWELRKQYPKVRYVLSRDIPFSAAMRGRIGLTEQETQTVVRMRPDETCDLQLQDDRELQIETFRSTDEGVAFFLTYEGKTIYHAGDLHLWLWEEEGEDYVAEMEQMFYHYTEKLKGRSVNVACLLLDPRLEQNMYAGIDAYLKMMRPALVFPMHMWGQYEWTDRYLESRKGMPGTEGVQRIEREGQEFIFE